MKKILNIILLVLIFRSISFSQTIIVSTFNMTANVGDTVSVPIMVANFNNVGAITVKMQYDGTVLQWIGAQNWNSQTPGGLAYGTNGIATISWTTPDPTGSGSNINSGTLVDFIFLYKGGTSNLTFLPLQSEITDINTNILLVNFTNGGITHIPQATDSTTIWREQIRASVNNVQDTENYAGVSTGATEGLDYAFDIPKPPVSQGNYISVYFPHNDWNSILGNNFSSDIKQNTSLSDTVKRWFFNVETNFVNDSVTLTFLDDRIPPNYGKYLTDFVAGKRINLKQAKSYTYYDTSLTPRNFMLIIGDSTAPVFNNLWPNGSGIYRSGTSKNINWQSSDGTGIDSIFIYVSSNAGVNYTFLKQVGNVQSTSWQIPAEYLNNNYSLKVIARDSLGNSSSISCGATFTVVGDSLADTAYAGWTLISSPLRPYDSSFTSIFNDGIGNNPFYIWSYNQNNGLLPSPQLNFGEGYWLGLLNNQKWDVKGYATEQDSDNSTILGLNSGFNIIGNTYVRAISKSTIFFIRNGIQYSFDQAVADSIVSNTIYGYQGNGYYSTDTLDLFAGYWLGILQDSVKMLQRPEGTLILPNSSKVIVSGIKQVIATSTSWDLPLSVSSNNMKDKIAELGVRPDASDGFDNKYDSPRPPRNPGNTYLELSFVHSGGNYPAVFGTNYAKDYKSPSDANWSFQVVSSANSQLLLNWNKSQISSLPDSVKIILKDLTTGTETDMKTDSAYSFIYSGVRNFVINSSITEIKNSKLLPTEFNLYQNYPNPFNPSTIIKYALPFSSNVKIDIFNILGEKIKELVNEQKNTGYYNVNFNTTGLASGVYFYMIEVKSIDGKNEFRDVKKMVLLK